MEVRKRGTWRNVGEYLIREIRLVTCKALWVPPPFSPLSPPVTTVISAVQFASNLPLPPPPPSPPPLSSPSPSPSPYPPLQQSLRLVLPPIEYARRERSDYQKEEFASNILQKSYRGYRGRSLFRRLLFRAREEERQKNRLSLARTHLLNIRTQRNCLAAKIQSTLKGFLWRLQVRG